MKIRSLFIAVVFAALAVAPAFAQETPAASVGEAALKGKATTLPFNVYTDSRQRTNHFIPSGYMGDWGDIKVEDKWKENPKTGETCLKITYTGAGSQGANWAGVYWQNPANNWGTKKYGGFDLSGAKRVTFWARGEKGGERIEEFKVGGITGEYSDTDSSSIGPIELTTEWQQFTIDLEGKDLTYISGGFCWAANTDNNPDGLTFYLDEIVWEG